MRLSAAFICQPIAIHIFIVLIDFKVNSHMFGVVLQTCRHMVAGLSIGRALGMAGMAASPSIMRDTRTFSMVIHDPLDTLRVNHTFSMGIKWSL